MNHVIMGCGDIGQRIAMHLNQRGVERKDIIGYVRSAQSAERCAARGIVALKVDIDDIQKDLSLCRDSAFYYTVPPAKQGLVDARTDAFLELWSVTQVKPKKVVLISTTGVYGDCDGEWVTEASATRPTTERGKRRLYAEQRWQAWAARQNVPLVILRVPGIYAYSRLPIERLKRRTPVVVAAECGFSNRIHADDLARFCCLAMQADVNGVFNATDGTPGKISEYLQVAAQTIGMEPLPEISMQQAQSELSAGMLSYLSESRKISNEKILSALNVELLYPDFRKGIRVG